MPVGLGRGSGHNTFGDVLDKGKRSDVAIKGIYHSPEGDYIVRLGG